MILFNIKEVSPVNIGIGFISELLNKTNKLIYYLGTEETIDEELIIKKKYIGENS